MAHRVAAVDEVLPAAARLDLRGRPRVKPLGRPAPTHKSRLRVGAGHYAPNQAHKNNARRAMKSAHTLSAPELFGEQFGLGPNLRARLSPNWARSPRRGRIQGGGLFDRAQAPDRAPPLDLSQIAEGTAGWG